MGKSTSPKVLNKRTDEIPPDAVYVGRPSKWGNPVRFPKSYSSQSKETKLELRRSAIRQYREYLEQHPELVKEARRELKGRDLVCWCAPLPCHADVLLEIANGKV